MRVRGLLIAALLASLPMGVGATNGLRPIGYGTKSKGMGGVGVALPQDSFASALNPAGMAFVCDRVDIGVQWLRNKADGQLFLPGVDSLNSSTPQNIHSRQDLWWPEFGVSWMYCPYCVLGLNAYAFGGWKLDYNEKTVLGTSTNSNDLGTDLGWDYQVYFISPSWACTVACNHTIGVAANIAISALDISGFEFFSRNSNVSAFPEYGSNKGTEFQHGLGLQFGWIGQFDCGITLGIAYKTKTWMNHFKKYRGFLPQDGQFDLPSIWSFGATWCVTQFVVISADFERIMWTDARLFRHDFFNGDRFGTSAGPGFGWEDQSVIKLGAAWDISDAVTLRVGYNFGTALYANRDLLLNLNTMQVIRTHYTLGLTYYTGCHELSIDFVHGDRHRLEWTDQNLVQPVMGFNTLVQLRNRADQDSVGVSWGYHY